MVPGKYPLDELPHQNENGKNDSAKALSRKPAGLQLLPSDKGYEEYMKDLQ